MKLYIYRVNILFPIFITLFLDSDVFSQEQHDIVKGTLIQFNDNGAWCWYQDERAVIDITGNKLILGSDASNNGFGGSPREGDVEAVIFDINKRSIEKTILKDGASSPSTFYADDHNAPAFIVRPDGKYLAMYAAHFGDTSSHYRIYEAGSWGTEQLFRWKQEVPGGANFQTTYSNVYYLSAYNRMYNFVRGNNRSPNLMISYDMGDTWSYGGQLTTSGNVGYNNGYYRYWGNGIDRIDFIFTEAHPRDFYTSIYHGYIHDSSSFKSDGTIVDENIFDQDDIPAPADFTLVFADNTMIGGAAMRRCWNTDVVRYDDGVIATIVTARADQYTGADNTINPDHRFIYCRYNGSAWSYTYLGKAGPKLYSSEADYTGNAAIHPNDPNTIYISTTIDPRDVTDLGVHEIFKGTTSDDGDTWDWTPITWNTTPPSGGEEGGNIRPIIPAWDENNTALLWFRGTYFSAQNFDAAIVGIIDRKSEAVQSLNYIDANASNTTLSDGSTLITTGPDGNQGGDDDQWHIRTGYGNGGSVYTSSETGNGENAPVLKTKVHILESGTYDIWINFWRNPDADWRIKAGFSENDMKVFRQRGSEMVQVGEHGASILINGGGNTFLYQAYLGRLEAADNDSFYVYVDDDARQTGSTSLVGNTARTWYDGISYATVAQEVIPSEIIGINLISMFQLGQNYPNPFNPATTINFSIPVKSIVNLEIYDLLGNKVATLVNEEKSSGNYSVSFDGSSFSSGIYYYRISAGSLVETRKMILLK